MPILVLVAFELSIIIIALGFLLESQSNSTMSNVVAGLVIVVGICCLAYALSKSTSLPTKELPSVGSVPDSSTHVRVVELIPSQDLFIV